MGSDVLTPSAALLLFSPFGLRISHHNLKRCYATSSGGNGRWDLNSNSKLPKEGPRDNTAKQRIWWSDDYEFEDDYDDVVEDASIAFAWIIKVLSAFGWMLPAIIMSAVLGTGTNTIIMALVLPLAQSTFSLVLDAVWGWSDAGPRFKSKKKKRPYARGVSTPGMRVRKGQYNQNGKAIGDSNSWAASNGASNRKKSQSTQKYGGWDELDIHTMEGQLKKPYIQSTNRPREWTNGKLSKTIGRRETPLLLRLLIAAFPFLEFWNKLL